MMLCLDTIEVMKRIKEGGRPARCLRSQAKVGVWIEAINPRI